METEVINSDVLNLEGAGTPGLVNGVSFGLGSTDVSGSLLVADVVFVADGAVDGAEVLRVLVNEVGFEVTAADFEVADDDFRAADEVL